MSLDICAAALIFCVCGFLLRNLGWRGAPVLASVGIVILLADGIGALGGIVGMLRDVLPADASDAVSVAVKALGLSYLFGISADICRELGEQGIAKCVEVVGRVEIISLALPYFRQIIELGVEFMG